MRFLTTPALNRQMRAVLLLLISAASLFTVSHTVLEAIRYGVTPAQITSTILGDEELFIDPIPFEELLLEVHMNLFFIFLLLAVLGASYIRLCNGTRSAIYLVTALGAASLTAQAVFLLIPAAGTAAAALWIFLTVFWHLTALFIAALCAKTLLKGRF
ncbi:hypothetical protein NNO_0624 [Hydrogenimonas sp.]|nr:hypothetical protein NNO_0624 [Hydrogenimonas sp.]